MNDLETLFSDRPQGGVFRAGGSDDLAARLATAGWSVTALAPFDDMAGFYTEIATRLQFPDYFGRNLDALWDCLRAIKEPTAVIIPWTGFASADPGSADRLLAVLTERAEAAPPFAVILL